MAISKWLKWPTKKHYVGWLLGDPDYKVMLQRYSKRTARIDIMDIYFPMCSSTYIIVEEFKTEEELAFFLLTNEVITE